MPSCRQCDVLARRCCAHILRATVLKWTAMRWTGRSMPGMGGKATGLRHDEGMAGQSTTSRANHQAPEREAPQALPCPPRHGVFYADPFLFAWMWSLYAGLETEAHRSLGTARRLRLIFSPFRLVTRETWFLSAFVAVMFTRRQLDDERRGGARLCSQDCALDLPIHESIF